MMSKRKVSQKTTKSARPVREMTPKTAATISVAIRDNIKDEIDKDMKILYLEHTNRWLMQRLGIPTNELS